MVMSATALLNSHPNPSRDQIKEALSGNLCRCTGYQNIVTAIKAAAATLRASPLDAFFSVAVPLAIKVTSQAARAACDCGLS